MSTNEIVNRLRRLSQNANALANELEAQDAGVTIGADERPAKIEKLKGVMAEDCGVLPVKDATPEARAILDTLFKSGS